MNKKEGAKREYEKLSHFWEFISFNLATSRRAVKANVRNNNHVTSRANS
jgi:hypothetical protein